MTGRSSVRGVSVRGVGLATLCLVCLGSFAWGQDSSNQGTSLGDVARQTRAHHAAAEPASSKAQDLADEMQQAQDASDNAPVGFKSYDAGDYHLFVPYPYSLEGRDNGGAVLLGSRLGITNTEVMAGTPVPIRPNLSDIELANLVTTQARRYSAGASCAPVNGAARKIFRCNLGKANLLGKEVLGTMEYVVGSNSVVPVMCVSPDEQRQCVTYDSYGYHTCYNQYVTWQDMQRGQTATQIRYREERTTAQLCDEVVYPSIQLKEDIVVHPASISESKLHHAAMGGPAQESTLAEPESHGPSLGELARRTRQAAHAAVPATADNAEGFNGAPSGYGPFVLQYCQNPQQCFEAAVAIPEQTEVLSRTNGQHIFKATYLGNPVLLYAGPADVNAPYRSLTDPDFIRIRDLGASNGWSREKADSVSTQEMTIENRNGLMTRFRYEREAKHWWIGERIVIQNRGAPFLVGCTAPEDHFADAESVCTTFVNSLRLP